MKNSKMNTLELTELLPDDIFKQAGY